MPLTVIVKAPKSGAAGGLAKLLLPSMFCDGSTVLFAEFSGRIAPGPLTLALVLTVTTGSCVGIVIPHLIFDAEIGSDETIGWKRSVPGCPLESYELVVILFTSYDSDWANWSNCVA